MTWRPVINATAPDSASHRALTGKKIRTLTQLTMNAFDPSKPLGGSPVTIGKGAEGFVGYVLPDGRITVAFPKSKPLPRTFEEAQRKPCDVLALNWPTFSRQLEIDV